ncbi:lipopolysaccharide biosynthesis protein [Tannerella forsythia]|uniref:Lipopolysaccharide biosynthesis protein n=1 Tax=Tannerella forsythia TaxID=28112 RepID=A0A3P1YUQ5_TANFO|nr:oligosaccharide flippase family protein [Tannerella forsythia]RRD74415.1 lipopolysaccharide biosynthesis protein [Tannerella forsythia]
MSLLRDFFKSSSLYFLGNVLTKLVGFLMLPIFTEYLSPNEYGYYDVANTYLNLVISFLFLDIYVGIMRFIYDQKEKETAYRPIFNGFLIFMVSLLLYTLISWGIWFFNDIPYFMYIYGYGVCMVFSNLYGYLARAFKKNLLFAVSGIVATLITAIINFIGLKYFHANIEILYIASMLGLLSQIILIEYYVPILRKLSFSLYDRKLFFNLYKFSLPLCLNSLAFWLLTGYGNVMISRLLGLEQNGIYSIAIKFALVINLVAMCFNMAWQEVSFERGNDDRTSLGIFYSKTINLLISFLCIGTLCLIHFSHIVFPYMVDTQYADAFSIIPLAILSAGIAVVSSFMGQIYAALKKTNVIMYSTVTAAIVNMICMPLFISQWRINGAVLSLICSYLVNVIMRILWMRSMVHIRLNYMFLLIFAVALVVSGYIYYEGKMMINALGIILFFCLGVIYQRDFLYTLYRKIYGHTK